MTGTIIGNQNPLVGTTYTYEIKPSGLSFGLKGDYEWYLFKKQKNGSWKDITGKPKTGEKVTYNFGEIALGIEFQMKVYEIKKGLLPGLPSTRELAGSCILIPTSNKVPKIDKVVLFNRGAKDVNKASYRDTLIAQAHCIAMFNKEIEFHLWEDDAPGKGHDAGINKNNRHTRSYKARVNEKGIAEISIPLMSDEKILRQMANQFLMKGDRNEGANHEYYVTATYSGKIQGTSQVNVDVANPDHKGQPQNQPKPKPQPEKHTPKFPAGQGGAPKQPDPKGNIIEAVFIDDTGKELSKVAVGDKVRVRIHSKNMVGKHIQYVVWEYDTTSNDEVYRSGNIKIPADVCDTSGFVITKDIFGKGTDSPIGDPDSDTQNYFIEIISKDLSAESQKFGVNSEGLMKVEKVKSAAGVQKQPEPEAPKDGKCRSCQISLSTNDLDKFMTAAGHGSILNKAPYNTRIPAYINNLNKYMTDFEINNNCYRKANFLGQVAKETKFWSYKEDFIYPPNRLKSKFSNFKTEIGKKHAEEWGYGSDKSEITKEREIKIANWAYSRGDKAKDLGNNVCPENDLQNPEQDGYKFRGRGLIQLTGRKNYQGFQDWYNKNYTKVGLAQQDFMKNPDLLFNSEYIVLSAIYFWMKNNLSNIADKGIEKENVRKISNVINSGEDDATKAIRYDYVKAAHAMLSEKASDCPFKTKGEPRKKSNEWHDPIDNPQITLHNFSGGYDPDFSSFGGHRGRPHTGLDIFAINKKTKIYACLKGEIVYNDVIPGYGKTIVLKVDKDLLEKHKKNYTLKYDKEVTKGDLYDSGKDRYILYGHLNSFEFKSKNVEPGDVIAISGVTGVAEGTHGPHLHIEFSSKMLPQKGDNYKYRCNPLLYIYLSKEDLQLQKQYNKANRSTDKV